MNYKSLFQTAFTTIRKAPLAWLFGLAGFVSLVSLPSSSDYKSLGVLVCPLFLLVLYLHAIGELGVTLSLYHAYHDRPVTFREVWAEANYWLPRYFLYFTLWLLVLAVPFIVMAWFTLRLPLLAYTLITILAGGYMIGILPQYTVLNMIRQRSSSNVMRHALAVWMDEHLAKLVICSLLAVSAVIPYVVTLLIVDPGVNILVVTRQQYSSLNLPLVVRLLNQTWNTVSALVFASLVLSLYMHIIHEHPELDLAKRATPTAT